MSKKYSTVLCVSGVSTLISTLLSLCVSNFAAASSDPTEAAGLRHLFSQYGGIFLLDFDRSHKVINQSRNNDRLVVDDFQNGFRLLQNTNAGIGIEVPIHYGLPGGVSVGLDLLSGTNLSFDRYVKNRDELARMSAPRVPTRATDLSEWTVGDNALVLTRGGVGFAVGVGLSPVFGAGAYYFAEGDWYLYVEKTENNHAYLKITNTKIHLFGVLAHGIIAGIGASHFNETDQGFSFNYDLNDEEARLAYEDAVHGSLGPSDRLTELGTGKVVRILTSQSSSRGVMRRWYFGIPFFNTHGGSSGHIYGYSNTYFNQDGSNSIVNSGIYINHRYSAGWFSTHDRHFNDFYGSTFTNTAKTGEVTKGYAGQYLWAFESSSVSGAKLYNELGFLAAKTGIDAIRSIQVPQQRYLGYLNIKFSADVSQKTTESLMSWAHADTVTLSNVLKHSALENIENYFKGEKEESDPDHLCRVNSSMSLQDCKTQLMHVTSVASSQMATELRAMAETKDTDGNSFALHFGNFGAQMATNQFTFREVVGLTAAAPMTMTLAIEGERVSRFKKVFNASPNTLNTFEAPEISTDRDLVSIH